MAGDTASAQPQVGEFLGPDGFAGNKIRLMARVACLRGMSSEKLESREVMVEFRRVEADDLERQPVMVAVAGDALFPPHIRGNMISLAKIDPGFKLRMAGEAFVVGDLVPKRVASGAV